MLKKRIIPVILLRNGIIVQSRGFKRYQALGSPMVAVKRLSNWLSDELVYLDISPTPHYDLNRNDLNHPEFKTITDIIELVSRQCMMPLTFGGGIRTLEDARVRIKLGADKVTVNSLLFEAPEVVSQISQEFGSQCVVASVDAFRGDNGYEVRKGGRENTGVSLSQLVVDLPRMGVGEILVNSIDRDGSGAGYDIDLIRLTCSLTRLPVIAMGGAGHWDHFIEVLERTEASAVAAANIFQHTENSVYNCKAYLKGKSMPVRFEDRLSADNNNI